MADMRTERLLENDRARSEFIETHERYLRDRVETFLVRKDMTTAQEIRACLDALLQAEMARLRLLAAGIEISESELKTHGQIAQELYERSCGKAREFFERNFVWGSYPNIKD
jgi:hypothetical protein